MAEGPASRPRFFLDEQRNNAFMKRLGERSRFSVPSDGERQSAAAIRAVLDDDEDDTVASSLKGGADCEEPASHVVDLEDRPDLSTVSATKPATLWSRLQTGWEDVEDRLAEWFGLDQSKYQWAVDELLERQLVIWGSLSLGGTGWRPPCIQSRCEWTPDAEHSRANYAEGLGGIKIVG